MTQILLAVSPDSTFRFDNLRVEWLPVYRDATTKYLPLSAQTQRRPGCCLSRITGRSAIAVAVPTLALAAVALIASHATPVRSARLYVQTDQAPVELQVDGAFIKTPTVHLPFTSIG